MGFLDTLFGRTKPVQPKLDDLFALPSAAIQLQAATGFTPTGSGSVCFRAVGGQDVRRHPEGRPRAARHGQRQAGRAGLPVEVTKDSYGFTWLVSNHMSDEMDALVTDLHAVNSALVDNGFGPQLLCTLVAFSDEEHRPARARLPVQAGHVLPVRPAHGRGRPRDNALELQVKGVLASDLKIEPDLTALVPRLGAPPDCGTLSPDDQRRRTTACARLAGMPPACVQLKANDGAARAPAWTRYEDGS